MNSGRCLLCDLDGTLIDSEMITCRAFIDLLPDMRLSLDELVDQYRGIHLDRIIEDMQDRHGISVGDDFVSRYRDHIAKLFKTELKPFPGVAEALERIKSPVCVASSAPQAKIKLALTLTGLNRFFGNRTYSAYDIGAWKPDPAVFLAAADDMGFAPEQCVVLEDSAVGLEAAKAANMTVFHFDPYGMSSEPFRFTNWQELPALLAGHEISVKDSVII